MFWCNCIHELNIIHFVFEFQSLSMSLSSRDNILKLPLTISWLIFFQPEDFTLKFVAAPGVEVILIYDRGGHNVGRAACLVKE
jgi:hypothetical protein